MKRQFFNWLIILLGVIAITSFCFTPAFAEEEVFNPWNGIQVEDNSVVLETAPDPNDLLDDSFGAYYQYTWVTASAFVPHGVGPYFYVGAYRYRGSGSSSNLVASVRLPSGAHLYRAQLFYYDDSGYYAGVSLYRFQYNNIPEPLDSCSGSASAAPGYTACNMYPNVTIQNGDSVYQLVVYLSGEGDSVSFMGVRLYWKRQILTGLSHPFNDIGGLSTEFQNAIAALYKSGITTGTSSTTFSPNNYVTRGQMATFLARALGLYWGQPNY